MMLYMRSKFMKICYREDMIFIIKQNTKGHSSAKMNVGFRFLFSTHHLIMLYICTKFHKNIFCDFKVIEQKRVFHTENFKGA